MTMRDPGVMNARQHILFVCGQNRWRSPTAARIYAYDQRIEVRSAGLSPQSPHRVSLQDMKWADLVLVMEAKHKERLREVFSTTPLPPIECLEIPDDYGLMNETLIELIRTGTEVFLSARLGLNQGANSDKRIRDENMC
jgi:predicted protein tyrosine phosphatase